MLFKDMNFNEVKSKYGFEGGDLLLCMETDVFHKNNMVSIYDSYSYDRELVGKIPELNEDIYLIGYTEDFNNMYKKEFNGFIEEKTNQILLKTFGYIPENKKLKEVKKDTFELSIYLRINGDEILNVNEFDSEYIYKVYYNLVELVNRETVRIYETNKLKGKRVI